MKKILFFVVLCALTSQAQDHMLLMGNNYYSYVFINVGATPGDGQIIFSGASIPTQTTNKILGTNKAPLRFMHWKVAGGTYDSVAGYTKVLNTGVIQDVPYLWFQSGYWKDGTHYVADAVDTCYSLFPTPTLVVDEADTFEIILNFIDNSTGVIDSIRIFVADTLGESFAWDTTVTNVGYVSRIATDGKAYYGIAYATYSNRQTEIVYAEPLSPLIPDFAEPTNLAIVDDSLGVKVTWLKGAGYDSLVVQRAKLDSTLATVSTLPIETESLCDTIGWNIENTSYKYRLGAFDGLIWHYTEEDTGIVYYAVTDTTYDTLQVYNPESDSVDFSTYLPEDTLLIADTVSVADIPDTTHYTAFVDTSNVLVVDPIANPDSVDFQVYIGNGDTVIVVDPESNPDSVHFTAITDKDTTEVGEEDPYHYTTITDIDTTGGDYSKLWLDFEGTPATDFDSTYTVTDSSSLTFATKGGQKACIASFTGTDDYAYGWHSISDQIAAGDTYWVKYDFFANTNNLATEIHRLIDVGIWYNGAWRTGLAIELRTSLANGKYYQIRDAGYGMTATMVTISPNYTLNDNAWNTIIAMVKTSATSTSADGMVKYYLNGELVDSAQTQLNTNYSTTVIRPNLARVGGTLGTDPSDSLITDNFVFATDSLSLYPSEAQYDTTFAYWFVDTIYTSYHIDSLYNSFYIDSLYNCYFIDSVYRYWDADTTVGNVDFNCAEDGGSPTNPTSLIATNTGYTNISLAWTQIDTAQGYKIERKLGNEESTSFSQIAISADTVDQSDYKNLGDNITNWTQTVASGNVIGIDQANGNDAPSILFDYGGTYGQMYLATSSTNIAPFPYTDAFWITADVYLSSNFPIGTGIAYRSRLLTLFYTAVSSPQVVINAYSTASNIANAFNLQIYAATDIDSTVSTGFSTGNWMTLKIGFDRSSGIVKIYADNNLLYSNTGLSFDGTGISGIRLGSNGNATYIPSASDYIRFDNVRIALDSASLGTYIATPDTTYTDENLVYNTTYTYRVRGYNEYGNGEYSDTLRVTTLDITPPNAITNFIAADIGGESTDFTFTASTSPHDSTIFWWTTSPVEGTWTRVAVDSGITEFTLSGLEYTTQYQIYGKAVDYIGSTANYSASSNTVVFTTIPPPPPTSVNTPTAFAVTSKTHNSISYSFTESSTVGYDGTRIYWRQQGGIWDSSQTLANGVEIFTLTGLSSNVYYDCYIKAYEGSVYSLATNTLSTLTDEAPAPPSGGWTFDHYVSATATGGGNGTLENPWTFAEARSATISGDTILVRKGYYNINDDITDIPGGTTWRGEDGLTILNTNGFDAKYRSIGSDGDSCTFFDGNFVNDGTFSFGETQNNITFSNIFFRQNYAKYFIEINGADNFTLDSCVFLYPPLDQSTSHFIVVDHADYFTFKNSFMWRSPRTGIWVQSWASDSSFRPLIENSFFEGHIYHYCFQIMPYTNVVNPKFIDSAIVRGNTFYNTTTYNAFYLRHVRDFRVYNNLFINSKGISWQFHPVAPQDTFTCRGAVVNNTYIDEGEFAGSTGEFIMLGILCGPQQITVKNNLYLAKAGQGYTGEFRHDHLYRNGCNTAIGINVPSYLRMDFDYNLFHATAYNILTLNSNLTEWRVNCSAQVTDTWTYWVNTLGHDTHSLVDVYPTFIDKAGLNFRHSSLSSPGADDGTPIPWLQYDKDGNAYDATNPSMGCYQYVP